MKRILALFAIAAVTVLAQSAPSFAVSAGTAPQTTKPCASAANVGSIYTTITNPSVTYVCQQTGNNALGSGAFGWVSSFVASVTGGTLTIAANKTPVINNSVTFSGTDATTMTLPTTSQTLVGLTATQTLTNKTLTAPVMTTPTLGVATATSVNKYTLTAPATAATLTIADGKTLTASNSITLAGTDATTMTFPTVSSGVVAGRFCGATTGDQACANTSGGGTARAFSGIATLSSNSAVISGISPAFTSTSTFSCVANDLTTRANPVQVANTSSSSITITNTTGATDVINYLCFGY